MVPRRLSLACGSRQEVSSDSALSGDEDLNDDEKKIKKERRRKARNQRRYYRKHREEERKKARQRAARNRQLSKGTFAGSASEDEHDPIYNGDTTSGSLSAKDVPSSNLQLAVKPYTPPSAPLVLTVEGSGSPVGFSQWNAQQRLAYCRRTLQELEWGWGPVHSWPHQFIEDWSSMQDNEPNHTCEWYDSMRARIHEGDRLLTCLGRIIDGSLPVDLEEIRDLWLQTHQLTRTVSAGVVGLQHRLDVILQYHPARA